MELSVGHIGHSIVIVSSQLSQEVCQSISKWGNICEIFVVRLIGGMIYILLHVLFY
jgi:hypothetical protein